MGTFFNYEQPGPGVNKDAPKKKGVALFFELLGRNLSKLLLSNMLYFLVSLPISALYYIIISYFLGSAFAETAGMANLPQAATIITLLVVILWGTGPVSFGYTYILRNAVREEHSFLWSDFFEKCKENFLHGLIFLIADIVMLICLIVATRFYWTLSKTTGGIFTALLFAMLIVFSIYTMMHFYMYELGVTFTNKISQLYKNSFIMAIATLPICILIGLIIILLSMIILSYLTPIGVTLVAFLCWISLMHFMVDFYTARCVKRMILDKQPDKVDDKSE